MKKNFVSMLRQRWNCEPTCADWHGAPGCAAGFAEPSAENPVMCLLTFVKYMSSQEYSNSGIFGKYPLGPWGLGKE